VSDDPDTTSGSRWLLPSEPGSARSGTDSCSRGCATATEAHSNDADFSGALTHGNAGRDVAALPESFVDLLLRHEQWVASDGREGAPLDVSGFDLRSASGLTGRRLSALVGYHAILYGMNLEGIALQTAQLEGADLRASHLGNSDLRGINLRQARLNHADLRDCNFGPLLLADGRVISSALDGADARQADFRGANLQRAVLRGANLGGALLEGARLDGADLTHANLVGTFKSPSVSPLAIGTGPR